MPPGAPPQPPLLFGSDETAPVTVTTALADPPFGTDADNWSVTITVSLTPPVSPAVYSPVPELIVPLELFTSSDQVKPNLLPPEAVNCCVPFRATETAAGETETGSGMMVTVTTAKLPSESFSCTTASPKKPARNTALVESIGSIEPRVEFTGSDQV